MKNYIHKILHYMAGNMFNNIILLIFLPIFSHFMIPEEFAVYTNIIIFITFARLFYLMGFLQSIFSYFYLKKTDDYKYTLINSMYITILVIGLIFSIIILFFKNSLSHLILKNVVYADLFPIITIIIFSTAFYNLTLSILNIMERSKNYAILGVISNFLKLLLFTYGAFIGKFSVYNVLNYILISSVVSMLIAIINIRKILLELNPKTKKKFSITILRPVMWFGLIMVPGTLALISMRVLDRYMLTYLSPNGLFDVGIYTMGYKVGTIMQFLLAIVSMVFFPYAMRIADKPHAAKSYTKIFNLFLISGLTLGTLIILFSNEIFYVFVNDTYYSAASLVFIGVISTFLHGVFNILNLGFYIKQKATKIASAVIIGTFINIGLNIVLIPKFGVIGAGYASIISYMFIVIFNYFRTIKIFYVNYSIGYVFLGICFLLLLSYLNSLIGFDYRFSFIKILVLLMGIGTLYLTQKEKLKIFLENIKDNKGIQNV